MTMFERIKKLADKRNKNMKQVATELGFSENLFYRWKTSEPKAKDLAKVADYFNVSTDYLLGRNLEEPEIIDLSEDDAVFAFDGKPVSQEEREMLAAMIMAHRANKRNKR